MNLDIFLSEYTKFCTRPEISQLEQAAKANLFGVYCNVLLATKQPSQARESRKPSVNNPATPKQIGMLRGLIREGHLDRSILDETLGRKEASDLIEKGLKLKQQAESAPKDDSQIFSGSYNQGARETDDLFS